MHNAVAMQATITHLNDNGEDGVYVQYMKALVAKALEQ